eukprot:TRINITY_DN686_c0_g1_i7.p1 TRINITY_DN686_c0_g1~~TRINITY_DN686_c0_g1_i7.p1  ORF type:complete len:435 (+),score=41.75 TRINITY_DN686_c0_g1_i7:356-1660(+)
MLLFGQANGTFNSFVSSMRQCTNTSTGQIIQSPHCNCDIGLGGWFQTPARYSQVSYLPPFAYDRYVVFTHVSQATVSGKVWFFLQTFDARAWICIVALFVMFTLLKLLDRQFEPPPLYTPLSSNTSRMRRFLHHITKSPLLYRLRRAAQSTLMRMLMLSDESIVTSSTTTRQWFLNIIIAVVSLFLVLSYEASMTASLVQESIQSQFQSAEDLQHCRIDPSEVCILRGGALETYWKNSIAIGDCHVQRAPQYFNSYDSLFKAVDEGQCNYAIVIESAVTAAIRERFCGRFVIVGEPIFTGGLSMLLPLGSNLTEPMSLATLSLQANQTVPSLSRFFRALPRCNAEVNTTLNFEKLRNFFFITFSFVGFIFLTMLIIPQRDSAANGIREAALSPKISPTERKFSSSNILYEDSIGGSSLDNSQVSLHDIESFGCT